MKEITFLADCLVGGVHWDIGAVARVSVDIEADDARQLVLHGRAAADEGSDTIEVASMTMDQLKAFAADEGIDLAGATKKPAVVETIEKALAARAAGA